MKQLLKITAVFYLILGGCTSIDQNQASIDTNLIPMYGNINKTESQKKADEEFIKDVTKLSGDRKIESIEATRRGWAYLEKGDWQTAMKRFNQAWLLDPDNSESYHGFAVISSNLGYPPDKVASYFEVGISKSNSTPAILVDYGRFLWTQSKYDESLEVLHKALEQSPTAFNARANISFVYYLKKEYDKACYWAKLAKENKDELEKGYLEEVCSKEGN